MDRTYVGVILGLVMPVLTALAFYKWGYLGTLELWDFLKQMVLIGGMGMLLAVSCLPNLALFSIFANIDKLKVARGLFLSTLVYAFGIVVCKFAL